MTAPEAAELAVAFIAPHGWYEDDHEPGDRPRCCEAIRCVEITLDAIGTWTENDARKIARAVIGGMKLTTEKAGQP